MADETSPLVQALLARRGHAYDEAMQQARSMQQDMTQPLGGARTERELTSAGLEKAVRGELMQARSKEDQPWYLPRSLVGDAAYRYQGVALHGLLAALALAARQPLPLWGNAGYVGFSIGSGRTQNPKIGEDGVSVLPDAPY